MCFLQNFAANFLLFLLLFAIKNAENDYFDQRLGCATPKHWLKYTTIDYYEYNNNTKPFSSIPCTDFIACFYPISQYDNPVFEKKVRKVGQNCNFI